MLTRQKNGDKAMDEMFLEIPKQIMGEYDAHPEKARQVTEREIQIMNWSWNIHNPANLKMSHQEASSKVVVDDISIQKASDFASVTLMQYCLNGQHISKANIICRKRNGDEKIDYYKLHLFDVMVKSINQTFGAADFSPETITLNFASFRVEYTVQTNLGPQGGTKEYGWDVSNHKKL
jgi:type VI secretion system secreted protein Hcp